MTGTPFKLASLTATLVAAGLIGLSPVALGHDDHDHDHGHDDHSHDDHGHDHDHDHDHEHDQLGAHVHGAAQLQVALDHDHVDVFLDSPSYNVVGFEHFAHDESDREALRRAEDLLMNADNVFVLTRSAQCSLENVSIDSEQLAEMRGEEFDLEHHDHDHDHGHDDHGHDDHGHDDHGHDHDHDHSDGSIHTEFEVTYRFHCDQPDNLIGLHANVFDHFPNFEELEVQWIVDGQQGAARANAGSNSVLFRN